MSEYTEGVCSDGAAILKDGQPMRIEEVLNTLESRDELLEALKGVVPILVAVRYQVGLQGNQIERMEKARAAIKKAAGEES